MSWKKVSKSLREFSTTSEMDATSGLSDWERVRVLNDGYGRPAFFHWDPNQRGIKDDSTLRVVPRWEREESSHILYFNRQQSGFVSTSEQDVLTYYLSNWGSEVGNYFGIRSRDQHRNRVWRVISSFAFQASDLNNTYTLRFKTDGVTRLTFVVKPSDWTGAVAATSAGTGWYPGWLEVELYFNREPKPSAPTVGYYLRMRVYANVWSAQANPGLPLFDKEYVAEASNPTHDTTTDLPLGLTVQASSAAAFNTFAQNFVMLRREA